jgi:hypothetical protein
MCENIGAFWGQHIYWGLQGDRNEPEMIPTSAQRYPYGPNVTPKKQNIIKHWLQGGPEMDGPNWAHVALYGAAAGVASSGMHLLTLVLFFR